MYSFIYHIQCHLPNQGKCHATQQESKSLPLHLAHLLMHPVRGPEQQILQGPCLRLLHSPWSPLAELPVMLYALCAAFEPARQELSCNCGKEYPSAICSVWQAHYVCTNTKSKLSETAT